MKRKKQSLCVLLGFGLVASVAGCNGGGGGGGSSGGGTTGTGDTSFSATDAASDELETFQVDVTDISLTRPDGVVLHTLPATQRVDFADLVNESQLLTAYGALAGIYKSVSMTLDFSNADVVIAGQTQPATVTDQSGNPITGPITLPIQFPGNAPLVVTPGLHRLVSLDFDLDGSCSIDTSTNTVQLGPVIKAEAQPSVPKPHDVFGSLASVTTSSSSIGITINAPARNFLPGPAFTINTTSSTIFFIEGQPAVGAAGFALATGMPLGCAVSAQGSVDLATRSITATNVEMWIPKDLVHGHVLSRDAAGNLTVRGLAVQFANDGSYLSETALFNQTITVQASAAKVYERFNSNQLDQNAIGVGARIFARGVFNQSTMTLDCSQGHVLLPETGIYGFLNQPSSGGTLAMTVARFGRRPVADFNFTVGTTVTADPNNYVINTSTLNVASIASGAPIAIRGLIAPWNQSPPGSSGVSNATAVTVVDRSAVAALYVGWPLPTAQDLTATTASLTVSTTGAFHHYVDDGFIVPTQINGTATIVPSSTALLDYFAIVQDGGITLYLDYASCEADLAGRLAAGANARVVMALGAWSAGTETLTASRVAVFLK
jgi:hypothetical protein